MEELPPANSYIRTLWAKLHPRTLPVVDDSGSVSYWTVNRVILASCVVEFYDDDGTTGLIIFGGGSNIQNELLPTLRDSFRLKGIEPQLLYPEQMRNIFNRYWRRIKNIALDPSQDMDWGGVRDARLGSKGKYIDVEASQLRNIRENKQIKILGFKSDEENLEIAGMKKRIRATFEATFSSVKISPVGFDVADEHADRYEQIFYDLAREIYFRVVGNEKWTVGALVQAPQFDFFSLLEETEGI